MYQRFRRIFVTGLLVTIPLAVTVFLLSWLFTKLDRLSPLLTRGLIALGLPLPEGFRLPGLGILFTVALVFLVGIFITTFVGRRIIDWGEELLRKIPLVRIIYGGAKQVVDAVASQRGTAFNQVVLVEYPRKGLYSIGFLTCENSGEIQAVDQRHLVNVFIPTTPNPTSGLLIVVPQEDVVPLSMTVEDGIKFIMSGGLLAPEVPLSVQTGAAPSLLGGTPPSEQPPTPSEDA
ncbi:MAG: DUF502 domain-containing protein [Candidatus Tectimicrobiota bacterium]